MAVDKKVDQSGLKGQLQATPSGTQAPAVSPATQVAAYLQKMAPEIAKALPKHMTPDRLTRIALTTIRTNPKLLECNLPSLMAAVMQSAQLGLEPGLIGHCYIIPYGKEATFIIGYKGMIDLARRSGNIQSIMAHEVYENDFIELVYGLDENLKHVPWFLRKDAKPKEAGAVIGAYMVAKFNDGGHFIHYMPVQEIEQHRRRSKAANNGPWVTDYTEMCKKTVVRSGWKWLPISIEIMSAVEKDEVSRQDVSDLNNDGVIDIGVGSDYEEPSLSGGEEPGEMKFDE